MILGHEDKTQDKPFAVDVPKSFLESLPASSAVDLCKKLLHIFHEDEKPHSSTQPMILAAAVFSGIDGFNGKEKSSFLIMGWKRGSITLDVIFAELYDTGTMPDNVLDAYNLFVKNKQLIRGPK